MAYVEKICEAFGGVRPMARALRLPVSTVQSWKDRGSIPDQRKSDVMFVARQLDLSLVWSDFLPVDLVGTVATPVSPTVAHDVQAERGAA